MSKFILQAIEERTCKLQMGMEGVVKSRAKRWGRVIDETTWPEVLRRYLLASRAGLAVPPHLAEVHADTEAADMDDNLACIVGAQLLSQMPYHRSPPPPLPTATHPLLIV